MKKIVFVIRDIFARGGMEKVTTLIANGLSKEYDVHIVSLFKSEKEPFFKIDDNVKVSHIYDIAPLPLKSSYFKVLRSVKAYFKSISDIDVVISVGSTMIPFVLFLKKRTRIILWEHFHSYFGHVGGLGWLGKKMAAHYDIETVVLTKKDLELNKKRFKTKRLYQIYNPSEIKENSIPYDKDSKLIISAGRFEEQKGFDFIPEIATFVFSKHPDWQWHIYGNNETEVGSKLRDKLKGYKLDNNVFLKGSVNNLNELYPKYAMFVLTSRFEGFCMVNIEAHASHLPIIAFNCPCGPDEIIQDGINGYLVECFDTKKMGEKINDLIEHQEKRIKMSENTSLDKDKFKFENIIDEWKKILNV